MQSRYSYDTNTQLHMCILVNDFATANELIKQTNVTEIIKKTSLGNTPLMLALKVGTVEIAKLLLESGHDVGITIADERGLTPLHWACMLRQDELIALLLDDKDANPHHRIQKWVDDKRDQPLTPMELYKEDTNAALFYAYSYIAQDAYNNYSSKKDYGFFQCQDGERMFAALEEKYPDYAHCFFAPKTYIYQDGFVDRATLYIPGALAYTDIIFHMKDIFTNLKWPLHNVRFINDHRFRSSHDLFRVNFDRGRESFCKLRNAIPVNQQLLQRMENISPIPATSHRKLLSSF